MSNCKRGSATTYGWFMVLLLSALLAGCGGSGGGDVGGSGPPPTPTSHMVTISWAANHETAVNRSGGGYIVNISGQTPISVPYESGPLAPTSKTVTLLSGTYTVTVVAFSALNPPGGGSGSTSAASAPLTINVPF